ncbi:GNAT family N-acetyltransferase [Thermosipho ferrireducens]|uniref:GNAT family N-acetyltransferase n=1 Tax=Thermosipho ferrireducens TaxID=2571116 RepID=A0ABX7S8Q3_9BACT|nr:GNAT family protein [Thermosipho ferrireducens]QTA37485.1 GNAT family N-acetyltransferase [Thermosipho ferrireducens]
MLFEISENEKVEIAPSDLIYFSETRYLKTQRRIVLNFIESEKVIGFVTFDMRYFNKNAYITYYLLPEKRGMGKGKEMLRKAIEFAFKELNLRRLTAEVYDYNVSSKKVLEKLGFVVEGVVREGKYHEGKYYNIIIYGLLKGEWKI